jgi:hypothetical protein
LIQLIQDKRELLVKIQNKIGILYVLFYNLSLFSGFSAGTLVKTVHGYIPIDQLSLNDNVICYDFVQAYVEKAVTHRLSYAARDCIALTINQQQIVTASNQQFYLFYQNAWKKASQLQVGDVLVESDNKRVVIEDICLLNYPVDLYDISVKDCHNFLITDHDIVAHNFPQFFLGLSWLFGMGGAEFAGCSAGGAFLGGILGFKLHKNQQTKKLQVAMATTPGGLFPHDPEEERKRKRGEQRALTNKEARKIAKELGYKEVKGLPWSTRNELTFQKGQNVISPDQTFHKGGVWKMFNKAGRRLGTWNINLTKMLGE